MRIVITIFVMFLLVSINTFAEVSPASNLDAGGNCLKPQQSMDKNSVTTLPSMIVSFA